MGITTNINWGTEEYECNDVTLEDWVLSPACEESNNVPSQIFGKQQHQVWNNLKEFKHLH